MLGASQLAANAKAICDRFRREWGLPEPPRTIDVEPVQQETERRDEQRMVEEEAEEGAARTQKT